MEDAKGFKWFIHNYGQESEINLLTIDLLWDFFCGKKKAGLNDDVSGVLNSYETLQPEKLTTDERRVLKTILLLQAISMRVTGSPLLVPNDQNVNLAFQGTDWSKSKAICIAQGMIQSGLLFEKPVAGGKTEYAVASAGSSQGLAPYKDKANEQTKTQTLIVNGALAGAVALPPSIAPRFITEATGHAGFASTLNALRQRSAPERFKAVLTFAMDDAEAQQIRQQILKTINMPTNELIFVECLTPMGHNLRGSMLTIWPSASTTRARTRARPPIMSSSQGTCSTSGRISWARAPLCSMTRTIRSASSWRRSPPCRMRSWPWIVRGILMRRSITGSTAPCTARTSWQVAWALA